MNPNGQDSYLTDGDDAFVGLNSRDNPASLPAGIVSNAINLRLDRGIARTRKGVTKYTELQMYGPGRKVVGSGVYLDANGQEIIMVLLDDSNASVNKTFLYQFNPALMQFVGAPKDITVRIQSSDGVTMVHAAGAVYISRGYNSRPIRWDMANTFLVMPDGTGGTGHYQEFPNCKTMMFYMNRLIANGKHHGSSSLAENRYTVSVSHFLDFKKWPAADAFSVNQGGNDELVGLVPWTMNEFLVLMRNSTFYLNTGISRYGQGDVLSTDSALYTLSTDIGCVAERTAVQVGGGVMFLSDNGVYILQPNPTGSQGVKLLTMSEPVSANIDNWIQRINKEYAHKAVAAYWNNRYYLAVPIDNSTVNNAVLVFNFILKNWESVDLYPPDIDFMNFHVAKRGSQRRLFGVDSAEGILLLEDGETELYGPPSGTPYLSALEDPVYGGFLFYQDFTVNSNFEPSTTGTQVTGVQITVGSYNPVTITGEITTRTYDFKDTSDKRYSSVEFDLNVGNGGIVEAASIINNPDSVAPGNLIDKYTNSEGEEDLTRRIPVRKIAYSAAFNFKLKNRQSSLRKLKVRATVLGKKNISKK